MYEKVELGRYLEMVRKELKEYSAAAVKAGLQNWEFLCDEMVRLVQEIAENPNATTWALEGGEIYIPKGLTVEQSVGCCADNFFLLVEEQGESEDTIAEFAFEVLQ